jgi:hypothetical protein
MGRLYALYNKIGIHQCQIRQAATEEERHRLWRLLFNAISAYKRELLLR